MNPHLKVYGRGAVSDFLGDRIVYRGLDPVDPTLPRRAEAALAVGLPAELLPRKTDPEYARLVAHLLRAARAQDGGPALERLVFVGDTRLLDGSAFANLCTSGEVSWGAGLGFIGSENGHPPAAQVDRSIPGATLFLANRWAALEEFDRFCTDQGQPVGPGTAVVIDLDKTCLGARGRNGEVIDLARQLAVRQTVESLLGASFDLAGFQRAYDLLNQPEFHPFTLDNQDYLAYICLILGSGLYTLEGVVEAVRCGSLLSYRQMMDEVEWRKAGLAPALAGVHDQIYAAVLRGDPTPFKAFRRNEYRLTTGLMGHLPGGTPLERILRQEIVLTAEVRRWALAWRQRGALLFGLSDKPDEASLPTTELAAQGAQPIHRTVTHVVGE